MANKGRDKSLGEVIRDARVGAGHSLRGLARSLEITPSYQSDIENDRRVPSEEVLKKTAEVLSLDFKDLMALAGRFGKEAERYLRRRPTAGALFRKLSESDASEEVLRKLLHEAEEHQRKKEGGE